MNLQLCSPYKKCPFNCPMCIAATDDGEVNNVFNLFEAEPFEYMKRVIEAARNKETVVITGDTEPTLFPQWISKMLKLLSLVDYNGKIELQTKNYNLDYFLHDWANDGLTTVAYSATCPKDIDRIIEMMKTHSNYCKTRLVVLLTEENVDHLFHKIYIPKDFSWINEITFKVLQNPDCEKAKKVVNKIKEYDRNKFAIVLQILREYTNCSIKVDTNCMDAEGRYEILRINGVIYNSWF